MNNLLHRDSDDQQEIEDPSGGHGDREITLGTTMILAIFFALAVFAAIFFGFGYSMGSKRTTTASAPGTAASPATSYGTLSTAKPAAGSPANADNPGRHADAPQPSQMAPSTSTSTALVAKRPPPTPAILTPPPGPVLPIAQQPVVQIAAVSHQEDADLLVSTLKRRGYAVAVHADPRDKLLHVQVGPFSTRQEADAMRQRLIADGFNAMVKEPSR